ncbi:hypothetical protein L0B53_00215 [Vibrio sp. SS-MA-C1-2]|uniref:hypothetical protein n=1 Tax=Vibrio sp. SS-MA-C1-2 TaxID=2908646 RepID=UPI001F3CC299|nr:hypothetical protein [Vibrio sp. SS-MA-C1-2]UJF17236.1 hypothetical protein L0B53_00215 [Vibrio sp. SS-MA-C1-2]
MDINRLKTQIGQDIKSKHYSFRSIIKRHIHIIEYLVKNEGFSYKSIFTALELPSYDYFIRSIRHAKSLNEDSHIHLSQEANETQYKEDDSINITKPVKDEVKSTHFTKEDWQYVGITSDYLIKKINSLNITPEQVKSWKCSNEFQITKKVTEYRGK